LRRDDVHAVKELIADVVLEFYSDLEFLPKNRTDLLAYYAKIGYLDDLDHFERDYVGNDGAFLVLEDEHGIHGCGGLKRLNETQGELVRLWLRNDLRGRGFGKNIFDDLMKLAMAIGYREIFLDTSHRCTAALSLFRRNGFRECPKYKDSIGDIYMRKEIGISV